MNNGTGRQESLVIKSWSSIYRVGCLGHGFFIFYFFYCKFWDTCTDGELFLTNQVLATQSVVCGLPFIYSTRSLLEMQNLGLCLRSVYFEKMPG